MEPIKLFGNITSQPKSKTFFDEIKEMNAEKLAEFLTNITCYKESVDDTEPYKSFYSETLNVDIAVHDSYGDILEWLKKPIIPNNNIT